MGASVSEGDASPRLMGALVSEGDASPRLMGALVSEGDASPRVMGASVSEKNPSVRLMGPPVEVGVAVAFVVVVVVVVVVGVVVGVGVVVVVVVVVGVVVGVGVDGWGRSPAARTAPRQSNSRAAGQVGPPPGAARRESLSEFPCNGPMRLASGDRSCQGKDADEEGQEDSPRAARRAAGGVLQARGPDRS